MTAAAAAASRRRRQQAEAVAPLLQEEAASAVAAEGEAAVVVLAADVARKRWRQACATSETAPAVQAWRLAAVREGCSHSPHQRIRGPRLFSCHLCD